MKKNPHPAVGEWLIYLKTRGKNDTTVTNYHRASAHFATWSEQIYCEPFELTAIIPRDVTDWKAYQQMVEKAKLASRMEKAETD